MRAFLVYFKCALLSRLDEDKPLKINLYKIIRPTMEINQIADCNNVALFLAYHQIKSFHE